MIVGDKPRDFEHAPDNKRDDPNDLSALIGDLSDEKRELLKLLMQEDGIDISNSIILPQKREFNPEFSGFLLPLSFAQKRLWFLDQLEPGSPVYNIPSAVRLTGDLNFNVFEKCVQEIIKRHEALRTRFVEVEGRPYQLITPVEIYEQNPIQIPLVDLRAVPFDIREAQIYQQITIDARVPFDLSIGPLIRVKLYQISSSEYIASINIHHILADLWSVGVMLNEIGQLYTVFSFGVSVSLPKLPIQYADFAVWQNSYLSGEVLDNLLTYWRKKLEGAPPVLDLPTDRPRPAVYSVNGGSLDFKFAQSLYRELLGFNHAEGVTMFMTLLTIFIILLHRYSGQEDFCVGVPVANRTKAEIENLIGFFVNTLVIRANISGDPSFEDMLNQIKETTIDAYAHQDLPFELLVEKLEPERNASHSPFFQVMFATQHTQRQAAQIPNLRISSIPTNHESSKYDMTLLIIEEENGLTGLVEYNSDLFDRRTIENMMKHYQIIVESALKNPLGKISHLAMHTSDELEILLNVWNETSAKYPEQTCVHQLFDQYALDQPHHIAMIYQGGMAGPLKSINYGELKRKSDHLAYFLRSKNVNTNVLVGVLTSRSIDTIIAILAILKAGGVYLPLDPNHPSDRLIDIIRDSGVRVILLPEDQAQGAVISEIIQDESDDIQLIPLLEDNHYLPDRFETVEISNKNLDTGINPDNLAYVIYTSGSTGKPKGTLLRHRGLSNLVTWQKQTFQITPDSKILQFAPFSFDASIWEIFMALSNGACLVSASQDILSNGFELIKLIKDQAVTIVTLPPSVLAVIPEELSAPMALPALRVIIAAGESCTREIVRQWAPGRKFFNAYGPTETTVCATASECDPFELRSPSIGTPIANMHTYVLDQNQMLVPIGVPGELYIAGVGVAQGYLNRPELTAEKFILCQESPIGDLLQEIGLVDRLGETMYRSGDRVKYRQDGSLDFLGRIDHQVKLRGYRIELGEIEAVIREFRTVDSQRFTDVAVILQERDQRHKRLVAFASPAIHHVRIEEIYEFLARRLPEYMIPVSIVQLDQLPMTVSGKIDRKKLEQHPLAVELQREQKYSLVLPRNPEEEIVANIISEILGISLVGVRDNFFDLGGHSLLATQLISRIRRVFQIDLPLQSLFEFPVVEDFCDYIRQIRLKGNYATPPQIHRLPRDAKTGIPLIKPPLSFAQQRLWFLEQLEPGVPTYNIPIAMRISGDLKVQALEDSLNEIIRRHEVLRTGIRAVDGKPEQVILEQARIHLSIEDFRNLDLTVRNQKTIRFAAQEVRRSFDLADPPLIRITLVKLDEHEHLLLLTVHHIVSDGWSLSILVNEFVQIYSHISGSDERNTQILPELSVQYADYSAWQREWLSGERLQSQLSYWKNQLMDAEPILKIPTDYPRVGFQEKRAGQLSVQIDKNLSEKIFDLCRSAGVTPFMALLAAFQVLLAIYSGQKSISVGTPIANRTNEQVENLIGFFVNILVLNTKIDINQKFSDLLVNVRKTALEAYDHHDLPFELLVNELSSESFSDEPVKSVTPIENTHNVVLTQDNKSEFKKNRDIRYSPLFQVMFVYQNVPPVTLKLPAITIEPFELGTGIAHYDLTLSIADNGEEINGIMEYDAGLFKPTTIQVMIDKYMMILEQMVNDVGVRIGDCIESIMPEKLGSLSGTDTQIREITESNQIVLRPGRVKEYQPPRTPSEIRLAEIWCKVLGVEKVGLDDNFFELGGDSILSIQMTALANQAGLAITPRLLFEEETLERLANKVESASKTASKNASKINAEQGEITGLVPLTPIQKWFFSLNLSNPSHWNQSVILKLKQPLDKKSLEQAIIGILAHHDILRARFRKIENNWHQELIPLQEASQRGLFSWTNLVGLSDDVQTTQMQEQIRLEQSSLNIELGPIIRFIYFDLGAGKENRLLILIHHLVTDGISLAIILEDLLTLYQYVSKNQSAPWFTGHSYSLLPLPPKTTSFKYWAESLVDSSNARDTLAEFEYWLNMVQQPITPIPTDNNIEENSTEQIHFYDDESSIHKELTVEESQIFLRDVVSVLKGEPSEIFLAALVRSFATWYREKFASSTTSQAEGIEIETFPSNELRLMVAMEGHGRHAGLPEIDISRTVGWFTNLYPVVLTTTIDEDAQKTLTNTRELVHHIPQNGINFGVLAYLNEDIGKKLSSLFQPYLSFNYFGQLSNRQVTGWSLSPEQESGALKEKLGLEIDPELDLSPREKLSNPFLIEINAAVQRGRFGLRWTYDAKYFRKDTIDRFADLFMIELRNLIQILLSSNLFEYSTSDFPLAGIDQSQLEKLLSKVSKTKANQQKNL